MARDFRKPALWRRIFENVEPENANQAARLEAAFLIFRERTASLLERIAASLPSLTVHDITHIDALWETAELIVGPSYPLNPMEAFVLGGALLLHDAALCFEAYENGREGIRATVQWKDAFAAEREKNAERKTPLDNNDVEAAADFSAVRMLHADQAPTLIDRAWTVPDTLEQIFLLDDLELRRHFGHILGQIAASHNWSIEDLQSSLPIQMNAPGNWPAQWRIDPVKLACILRCADAAHIDNRRAPDFLYALTRREGISFEHWKAQNWLARADIDQSDPSGSTIAFTSSRNFRAEDADAWWVAYDAIRLVDKEIRQSNALLESRPQKQTSPLFPIRQVAGVSSPQSMNTFVRTENWKPWHAELHVGNIERLVRNLGGENLYGGNDKAEHFGIVLRELLQNARDAIVARRKLDKNYAGKIRVGLADQGDGPATLEVMDDGIGMSERVLTGPLLDFGSSFWSSALLNEEFPGLRSSGFSSIGRYGIGFYSAFMMANSVRVASRRWDRGLDTIATISFPRGLTLRPIFSTNVSDTFDGSTSTVVTCILKPMDDNERPSERILNANPTKPTAKVSVRFSDFVSRLVTGLDVPVEVSVNGGDWIEVHDSIQEIVKGETSKLEWLKKTTLTEYFQHQTPIEFNDVMKRLRPIYVDEKLVGLAALRTDLGDFPLVGGILTVGGFWPGAYRGVGVQRSFFGFMEQFPNSAKREPGKRIAPQHVLDRWLSEQLQLLKGKTLEPPALFALTGYLSDFEFDPTPYVLTLFFKGPQAMMLTLEQVFEAMKAEPIALFKFSIMNHVDFHVQQLSYENFLTFRPTSASSFLSLELEGDVPKHPCSFIGCLYRRAQKDAYRLKFETVIAPIRSLTGQVEVFIVRLEPQS